MFPAAHESCVESRHKARRHRKRCSSRPDVRPPPGRILEFIEFLQFFARKQGPALLRSSSSYGDSIEQSWPSSRQIAEIRGMPVWNAPGKTSEGSICFVHEEPYTSPHLCACSSAAERTRCGRLAAWNVSIINVVPDDFSPIFSNAAARDQNG